MKKRDQIVNLRVTVEERRQIEERARVEERTVSDYVRLLIKRDLKGRTDD